MDLIVTRETLEEENTFRYVLSCDGRVTDFKKDSKPYDYAGVMEKNGALRIIFLTNAAPENAIETEVKVLSINPANN